MGVAANGGSYKTTHHPYKLNVQFGTKCLPLCGALVSGSDFKFVPIFDIVGGSYDCDYLVDVIGMLTGVGTEREYERNGSATKLNVIAMEADGYKLQCTLFGTYVDELNTFLATGETANVVVSIQLAKVKVFQDNIHIQNCLNCTRLKFNPVCAEGTAFKNRMIENDDTPSPLTQLAVEPSIDPLQDFLFNTPRTTIQGLKDSQQEGMYVVLGTVKQIVNPENWYYTACMCNKSVYPAEGMHFCEKCNRHVVKVFPRYSIKVRVVDDSDCATFVLFDRDATMLFNKSCADILETHRADEGVLPTEIGALVNCTYLFKVEFKTAISPRFEQSFRVKKVCTDGVIINQFKAKWAKEEATFIKNTNEMGSLSSLLDKGKDMLVVGSSSVQSHDLGSLSETIDKDKNIIVEGTPIGISEDLLPKFSSVAVDLDVGASKKVSNCCLVKSTTRKIVKRVLPQPEINEVEEINLPIKLLKRNIKIEKI
ncbi:uncharacterized protein [Medicago truncatula]|nr:uncharacterized protein LOC120579381 [Medicago truncatula]